MRKYCSFDIEIAKEIPDGMDDWKAFRPLGISCAATQQAGEQPKLWYGRTGTGEIADQMSQEEAHQLVLYLYACTREGFTLLTWNGLGFDFDILAEESQLYPECQELALNHVDMMFHLFCSRGFPLGLDRAAKGMGVPGKPFGMSGELAPRYWKEGKRQEVLEYVAQDARTTLLVAQASERAGALRWISNTGKPQTLPLPHGWLTARQALALPIPDNSWMKRPWRREKFTAWLDQK